MAIIAAVLATVSMLSHKAHNNTLLYQGQATTYHTEASDQWNYYQAKKQRGYAKQDFAEAARYSRFLIENNKAVAGVAEDGEEEQEAEAPPPKKKKTKLKAPKNPAELPVYWKKAAALYQKEAAEIQEKARALEAKARDKEHKSHHVHDQAQRMDLGHLGLELALVLCAIALLAKQKGLWYSGLAVSVIGTVVSFSAYLL
jgi:hypothetical protein